MRLESHPEKLLERVDLAFGYAVRDTLDDAREIAGRSSRTGRFAASLQASPSHVEADRIEARIGSPLRSARAKEKGAYIQGRPYLTFPEHMARRLREQGGL